MPGTPEFLGAYDIIEAFATVDMSAGANNGIWISVKNYARVVVVLHGAAGAAGEPPTITFQQATAVAGTGAKAVNPTAARCWKKQAATSLAAVGSWTAPGAEITSNTWANVTGNQVKLLVAEFVPSDFDMANSFDCFRATIADVGATAQLGSLLYICEKLYQSVPSSQVSGLID